MIDLVLCDSELWLFQDIDECSNPGMHQCERICNNIPGNYTCSCPRGYHGDGMIDGEGCIADVDQLLSVKIAVGKTDKIWLTWLSVS